MEENTKRRVLVIWNDVKELYRITGFLETLWEDWALPVKTMYPINLVLEEAFSNIIFYAFDDQDTHMIGVEFLLETDKLVIIIKDGGKPFDPTAKEDPDTSLSVEERPIGGLGIFLIKKMMDEVHYERVQDKNHLTMTKYLNSEN